MLSTSLLLAAAFLPQGGPSAPVVINEFSYDDSSTDDLQFVELYNRSGAPIDLSGWQLTSEDPSGSNFAVTLLPGTILAPGAFYVIGDSGVPNVDLALGANPENSEESLTLLDASGTVMDTLVYESNKGVWNAALAEGDGVWGNHTLIESSQPMSWSRVQDGYDSDLNGDDFRHQLWTPGASNNRPAVVALTEDFDALTVGNDVPSWTGSFVNPRIIDPTVADANNPNAILASPQGGNAALCWDPSGGGNVATFDTLPGTSSTFEVWVYIDSTATPTGEYESFSIGFGSCPTFYNTPDPSGALGGFTANGLTGVAWTVQRLDTGTTVWLIDHNDGGWGATAVTPPTILGQLPITAGVNDGWQRLLLTVDNGAITGRFGGTYGQPDGTAFTGTTSSKPRGFHMGYREFLVDNSTARPVTFDALTITQCNPATTRSFGNALASSAAVTPVLTAPAPVLGATSDIQAASLLANSTCFYLFGIERAAPLTFGGLAPAGFEIWVDAFGDAILPTDAAGTATFPLTVPNDISLCGVEFATQVFQADPGFGALPIPAYHTDGLVLVLGA